MVEQEYAINSLIEFGQKGVLEPDDPTVVKPLMELLAENDQVTIQPVLNALSTLKAVSAIDLMSSFFQHDHPAVRTAALRCVISIAKLANRDDILQKTIPFLNDKSPQTSTVVAMYLKTNYPEKFGNIDLLKYINDLPGSKKK